MKKWCLAALIFCAAQAGFADVCDKSCIFPLEGKAALFYPLKSRFGNIYGAGGIYGAEVAYRFAPYFDLFADGMLFNKGGHSLDSERRHTRIKIVPASLGLKVLFPLPSMEVYAAASAKYINVNIHNHGETVGKHHIAKQGVGWGAKLGASVLLPHSWFFDIYLEYLRKDFGHLSSTSGFLHDLDISAGLIGGAVGYRF